MLKRDCASRIRPASNAWREESPTLAPPVTVSSSWVSATGVAQMEPDQSTWLTEFFRMTLAQSMTARSIQRVCDSVARFSMERMATLSR